MLSYQFAIWKSTARIEDLGNGPLSNDRDAFAFAKRVIRERLMHKDAERVAASVISNHSAMSALGRFCCRSRRSEGRGTWGDFLKLALATRSI
jgi:hypothetical protein